ncbi:MAG: DEAD/DEAH box helicase [Paludibacteraceae bacterium]|nr:DEAD/DEAH box helicase [Paludibacteraceae bacterium]
MLFSELNLKAEILSSISELGFTNPTPIQENVIPFILSDKATDLVALAQTGTGKTAAFGLPILNLVKPGSRKTQALVLSPTRELCIQICNELTKYSKNMNDIHIVAVYGGEDIRRQLRQLDTTPDIIVATPGRLIDLLNRGKVTLGNIQYLVLDEADEMLNMGFLEDIELILSQTPGNRRTMLFSATMPREIANIAKKYMQNSQEITVGQKNEGAKNVVHIYYQVKAQNKYLTLKRIADINPDVYGIIFCRTRQETKEVADNLIKDGYNADSLHGDLSQAQRDLVMAKFRNKHIQLLVATDVAARGLDVNDLTHVINYDLPDDTETYTHRSGRTGRIGKSGISIAIINQKEKGKIKAIEKAINKKFEYRPVPNGPEICECQLLHMITKMKEVSVNESQIGIFLPKVYDQLAHMSREEIISRFVSLEFNRFLDYYKDAQDLNVANESREERNRDKGRDRRRGSSKGNRVRLKLNMGDKQNFSPKRLLGLLNDITNDKSINVGDIEVTHKYTFFDVDKDQVKKVFDAFANSGKKSFVIAEAGENWGRDEFRDFSNKKGSRRNREDNRDKHDRNPRKERNRKAEKRERSQKENKGNKIW